MDCSSDLERTETMSSRTRISAGFKRKFHSEDDMPCFMVEERSLKRIAMRKVMSVPASIVVNHGSKLRQTWGNSRFDKRCRLLGAGLSAHGCMYRDYFLEQMMETWFETLLLEKSSNGSMCFTELTENYMSLIDRSLCAMEAQAWAAEKVPSFLQPSWSSCSSCSSSVVNSVIVVIASRKDAMQRVMAADSVNSKRKGEEDDKGKETPNRTRDGRDAKDNNTRSSKESKNEDRGDAGKESENDEIKETGEKRDKKDGEGEEEGKDDEKPEMEADENEEEEEREEERKGEGDTEVESAVCTVSTSPVEQVFDCSTVSDCRSHQSDDMHQGQEGLSCGIGRLITSKPVICSPHHVTDIDMGSSAYSASHLPMSDGSASHCMQHDSPCLQSMSLDANGQALSDMSRDMNSDALNSSIQRTSSYGSPGMQPISDVAGWQTPSDVSKDLYTNGSVSHSWQPATQASPPLPQTGADVSQQTSSGASKDCASVQPEKIRIKIKLPKDVTNNAELPSALEDGSGEEVLSKLKEVKDFPSTAKGLLSSGLLDGRRVYYHYKGSGSTLTGLVKDGGILCNCRLCKGKVVVNVSSFEKHAGSNARHPSDYIFLENGKSLQEIIKAGCQSSQGKVTGIVRKAANEEGGDRSSLRSGSNRGISAYSKKGTLPSSDSSKLEPLYPRSSQKQSSQSRDGSRHKLLFQPGGLLDGTEVAYYVKGQCFLRGTKKGHGICCGCCNEVISCSQFEAHAGWASRRNAYISMYLSNGQSLHEFALTLAAKDQNLTSSSSLREHDDLCAECGDGGDLVLCALCPKTYHLDCVGLSGIPAGDWCCPLCGDQRQHQSKRNMKDIGRVLSIYNREKAAERCHRVVKAPENMIGGCVFCKNGDFLKSGFGPKTIMLCDQCEREFHVGCMKERGIADLQELPEGEWFCCIDCKHIHDVLEGLVISGPEPVLDDRGNALGKQQEPAITGGHLNSQSGVITWHLLHGRRGNPENGRMLAEAASIFTESFDPILDATSGRDLISLMVYSRSIRDQDFQGMYCAVLKHREEVISAAVFRVFGQQFAEMPLVATASASRGQGYFQMLMLCIERLLRSLQVKFLILPAAEGAEGIWINKFGFSKLLEGQLRQFGSEVQIMIFQGSSMLFKAIL